VVRRLHPQILYGRNPVFAREVAALVDAGVTQVIDLREAWEWQGPDRLGREAVGWLEEHDVSRLHLSTADGGVLTPDALDRAVECIDAALASGGVVFVHCRAGQERTGAVLLAWLLTRGGDLEGLRELAPSLRPLPQQQAAVYDWLRARF
jgi:atypical dual specificity phosphatase